MTEDWLPHLRSVRWPSSEPELVTAMLKRAWPMGPSRHQLDDISAHACRHGGIRPEEKRDPNINVWYVNLAGNCLSSTGAEVSIS